MARFLDQPGRAQSNVSVSRRSAKIAQPVAPILPEFCLVDATDRTGAVERSPPESELNKAALLGALARSLGKQREPASG